MMRTKNEIAEPLNLSNPKDFPAMELAGENPK